MKTTNQPTKENIRQWLHQRRTEGQPPPSIERIRRQLGWDPAAVMTMNEKRVAPPARDEPSRIAT